MISLFNRVKMPQKNQRNNLKLKKMFNKFKSLR